MPALLGEDNGHAAPTPSEMGAAHDSKTMCALHMPLLEWVQHTTSRALCMPLIGWVCTLRLKRLGALRMPLIQQAQQVPPRYCEHCMQSLIEQPQAVCLMILINYTRLTCLQIRCSVCFQDIQYVQPTFYKVDIFPQ